MMDDGLIIIFNSNLRFLFLVKQMTKWPDLNLFAFWYKTKEFDVVKGIQNQCKISNISNSRVTLCMFLKNVSPFYQVVNEPFIKYDGFLLLLLTTKLHWLM